MAEDNYSLLLKSRDKNEIVSTLNTILGNIDLLKKEEFKYEFIEFLNQSSSQYINEINSIFNILELNNEFNLLEKIYFALEETLFKRDKFFIHLFFDHGKYELYDHCIEKVTLHIKIRKLWCQFKNFEMLISSESKLKKSFIDLKINYLNYTTTPQLQFEYAIFLLGEKKEICRINKMSKRSFFNFLEIKFRKDLSKRFIYLYGQYTENVISKNNLIEMIVLSPEDFTGEFIEDLKKDIKLKVKISFSSEVDVEEKSYEYFIQTKKEKENIYYKPKYTVLESERILIDRLNTGDELFVLFSMDLLISFIVVNFFELSLRYIDSFPLNEDTLYLKLEILLKLQEYTRFIESYNSNKDIHKEKIEFSYLKGLAYYELGKKEESKAIFKRIALKDSKYRKTKEYLNEEK